LEIDADLALGSSIKVKLYDKAPSYPSWSLLGEYSFDHAAKRIKITTPAYVDSVRYGLSGLEGIQLITTNTDSLPILHGITLKTRTPKNPPHVTVIQPTPNSAEKWDIYELTLTNGDAYSNPFWDVMISGKFTGPDSQEVVVEGFYYDDHTWKIRFSPTQEGIWNYTVGFVTSENVFSCSGNFMCTYPTQGNSGFINLYRSSPYKFIFSDGTPFIPIGATRNVVAQLAVMLGFHAGPDQVPDMWDYIALKQINSTRTCFYHQTQFETVYPWNPLEGEAVPLKGSGGLDRYNLSNMVLVDRWFQEAKSHGINFYVTFFNIFDVEGWAPFDSCYWSISLGGPYVQLKEMFETENTNGLEYEKKYCKYIVNRYAAYRNIVAWEYNNESGVYCTDDWLEEMDLMIDESDPYQRPHSASFWSHDWSKESRVNHSSAIDYTDDHFYPIAGRKSGQLTQNNEFSVDSIVQSEVAFRVFKYNKMAVFGEFGQDSETWDWNRQDSQHNYDRIALWAAYTAGAFPLFWLPGPNETDGYAYNRITIDYLYYFHRIISRFHDFLKMDPRNTLVTTSDLSNLRAYCLTDNNEYLVYVHHYSNHTTAMHNKILSIASTAHQRYRANWYNPSTGDLILESEGDTGDGSVNLIIPDFIEDVVLFMQNIDSSMKATYAFPRQNWYMVSLPVIPSDSTVQTLFPDALGGVAFGWDPVSGSYTATTKMLPKKGYWLAIPGPCSSTVTGVPLNSYTDHFAAQGWYMIGSVTGNSDFTNPNDNPDGSVLSPAFAWDPVAESYLPVTTLNEKQGYWVAVFEECDLTVGASGGGLAKTGTVDKEKWSRFSATFGSQPPAPPDMGLVMEKKSEKPAQYALFQNYPNPFNPITRIAYQMSKSGDVKIVIYDILGKQVRTLVYGYREADLFEAAWNGKDDRGMSLRSGMYLVQMEAGGLLITRKIMLLK
jgi:hypothetical protein